MKNFIVLISLVFTLVNCGAKGGGDSSPAGASSPSTPAISPDPGTPTTQAKFANAGTYSLLGGGQYIAPFRNGYMNYGATVPPGCENIFLPHYIEIDDIGNIRFDSDPALLQTFTWTEDRVTVQNPAMSFELITGLFTNAVPFGLRATDAKVVFSATCSIIYTTIP